MLDTSEEFYAGASSEVFNMMAYRDFENESTYFETGLEFELPEKFSLRLRGGRFDFGDAQDYIDYEIAISRTIAGFDLRVEYTDTDLSRSECAEEFSNDNSPDLSSRERI